MVRPRGHPREQLPQGQHAAFDHRGVRAGLPVVTTGAGGIPYIVEDGRNGLFVPIDDRRRWPPRCLGAAEPPLAGAWSGRARACGTGTPGTPRGRRIYTHRGGRDGAVPGAREVHRDRGMSGRPDLKGPRYPPAAARVRPRPLASHARVADEERHPDRGVGWSLAFVAFLVYMFVITTYRVRVGDVAMAVALFGLAFESGSFPACLAWITGAPGLVRARDGRRAGPGSCTRSASYSANSG